MGSVPAFCSACGTPAAPGGRFCTECGAPLAAPAFNRLKTVDPPRAPLPPPGPPVHVKAPSPPARPTPPHPPQAAPLPPQAAPLPPPPAAPVSAAAPATTAGGENPAGRLVANIFIMALFWALAWALADFAAYVAIVGIDNLGFEISDPYGMGYDLNLARQNAAGGAAGGALAGLLVSLPYFGALVWGWLRFGFTLVFWIICELVIVQNWDSLAIETVEEFLVVVGFFGLVYGAIFSMLLIPQKPGMGNLARVPLAALAIALAAVIARYLQFQIAA
ncbi:hypothetical protein SAMN05661107_0196 [Maritimibacter sp. HL-12]|nr:hypothetical protein SAMN05661107_0196 [Maritimibacter sp. HL-12]